MRALTLAATAGLSLALGACASDDAAAPPAQTASKPAQTAQTPAASGGLVFGGAGPGGAKFNAPNTAGQGAPDLNTVPTSAPTPPSTREQRAKTIEGLIADRTNARYSDQGGRTMPVAVRPLSDTPDAARTNAAARVAEPPPQRPAEAASEQAEFPLPEAVNADVGPRAPGASAPRRPIAGNETAVAAAGGGTTATTAGAGGGLGGFRSVSEYQMASSAKPVLTGTLSLTAGNLTASDRNVLNATARQHLSDKGVVRVIGHGTGGLDRAVVAARELQRLGVPRDSLFVGSETVTGPTEVYLDKTK